MEYQTKAAGRKKQTVQEFKQLMDKYPVVGVVNVENLPAKQLQNLRETLRKDVAILMAKKRLIRLALAESKKADLLRLDQYMKGMPAIIATTYNPFKLFKILKKNKSKAPIKAGQTAPNEIVVPAGPTPFAPGPIIGELGALKIKSGVENGKVAIKEDSVVAKEGDIVTPQLAGVLTRLGIEPMDIGLDVVALYENGEILTKEVLDVDEEAFIADIQAAAAQAKNLSINANIPTSDTIQIMLSKAHHDARNLAISQDIPADGVMEDLLRKAQGQAMSLSGEKPQQNQEDSTQQPEEPKPEPAKEEEKEDSAAGLGALFG